MSEYYFEYDRTTGLNVVYDIEKDGDRAVDIFSPCDFEEMLRKYPQVAPKEFVEFVEEMEVGQDE